MTDQEIIEALAKREGLNLFGDGSFTRDGRGNYKHKRLPPYLHSLDALQPVLEKLTEEEWGRLASKIASANGRVFKTFVETCLTIDPAILARAVAEVIGDGKDNA